jgi:hypothetical protein
MNLARKRKHAVSGPSAAVILFIIAFRSANGLYFASPTLFLRIFACHHRRAILIGFGVF